MRWLPWSILLVLICLLFLLVWPVSLHPAPTSAEIRLDTGDLRYLHSGKVLDTITLEEPYRSTILAASKKSDVLKDEWHRCATFPLPSSNNTHIMWRHFYQEAAVWASTEPDVGLLVLEDVAESIKETNAESSLPDCFELLTLVSRKPDGTLFIPEGWEEIEEVKLYLSRARSERR